MSRYNFPSRSKSASLVLHWIRFNLNDVEQMIADHINKVSEELPGFEPVGIRVANKINKDIQRLSESLDDLNR